MRLALLAFVLVGTATAQPVDSVETGRIAGVVTEVETREPLIGATVWLTETTRGASTDIDGRFVIEDVPAGTYAVRVSFVGFRPRATEVTVRAGETVWLAPELEEEFFECGSWGHCYDPVAHPVSAYAARRVVYDPYGTDRCISTEGMTEAVAR